MAYKIVLKCDNCGHSLNSPEIANGTTVEAHLAAGQNAVCPNCGCPALVKG